MSDPVHDTVRSGDVMLHIARSGSGPLVILLHGFPENWTSWRNQMGPLADAGFTVIAPDLRGYNQSDAPAGVEAYATRPLVDDIAAIVRDSGQARAHVVGHDWGGVVAWHFAAAHPDLLDRLVILNAPHPGIFSRRVRRPPQLFRSWYAAFFQLPALPEIALRAFDFAAIRSLFRRTPARSGTFSDAEIDGYVRGLAGRGRLTAVLNYYRAAVRRPSKQRVRTDAETLVIWGEQDVALTIGLLDGLERYAPNVRIERIAVAGHWVQNEAPDRVTALLLEFLGGRTSAPHS
ncbi:MAG: alpha/beta hydrolase [Gemmatimonadetes bacterium]|nr:alpha/beta hydrolase [Gemmatimonadota bacterium]